MKYENKDIKNTGESAYIKLIGLDSGEYTISIINGGTWKVTIDALIIAN